MSWHTARMCGFDLETTGIDVENDRIVTACIVQCGGGPDATSSTWLSDVGGMEISDGATRVHGISTAKARTEGRPAAQVVAELVTALAQAADAGIPIVAMNAAFDLTMLDREARRYGVKPLFDYVDAIPVVIDPRVLDKAVDRYRRGGRKLTDLCEHYRVPLDGAHTADADAIAACRVAWRIGSRHPEIGATDPGELHERQARWAREQADGLRAYFARTPGKEHLAETVRGEWPLIPFREATDAR